jgi:CTP-dependent riboflavin kinase
MEVTAPEYEVPLSTVPCSITGVGAFIIRTDKNDRGEGDHLPNVLEIASEVRLPDVLGLDDGDDVAVTVPDQGVETR